MPNELSITEAQALPQRSLTELNISIAARSDEAGLYWRAIVTGSGGGPDRRIAFETPRYAEGPPEELLGGLLHAIATAQSPWRVFTRINPEPAA